jgi:CheY-like chemotaxis protein
MRHRPKATLQARPRWRSSSVRCPPSSGASGWGIEPYTSAVLATGAKAYEPVRARPPAAILVDLRMECPDAGLKALELFKLDPLLSTTPIIVCSADLVQLRALHAAGRRVARPVRAAPWVCGRDGRGPPGWRGGGVVAGALSLT